VWYKKYISYIRNHDSLHEEKMSLKEKPKPKSHSKLNKWFKQANRSREQHPSVENTVTYTATTPEIATVITVEIRDATTDETPDATSTGIPTSEETKLQCNLC